MTALLSVNDVSKRFRGLAAISRVSFEVQSGEIFAVIGPNGAGKTTLFNMIAGAMPPDGGSIAFAGERIDGLRADEIAQRGVGRTFQVVKPFPALSVEDNVVVGALLHTTTLADARTIAHEVMSQLDLIGKRARSHPASLCRTASVSKSHARSRQGRSCSCSTRSWRA